MRKILRAAKAIVLFLVVLLLSVGGSDLAFLVYRQHATAEAIAIHHPDGINEAMYVKIGGIDQWIQICGQDRRQSWHGLVDCRGA